MLKYYFRETFAGRLINVLSGDRLLKAPQPRIPGRPSDASPPQDDVGDDPFPSVDSELKASEKTSRMSMEDGTYKEDVPISELASRLSPPASSHKSLEDGSPTPNPDKAVEEGNNEYLVGWYDDNDPENPRNWPMWLKIWSTCMISLLTFSIYVREFPEVLESEDVAANTR